ncbi:hypothetical protein DRZ77_00385 [Candidatus Woesearchaeota archaeon]|nr:YkgJ family cysteine cluster protein [Candidatus Woesearchaeota archaeon]RLE41052.1 MAG: hypothetical protein DRZ77_00385 [Candidatus Woesearchaeota archaeon]
MHITKTTPLNQILKLNSLCKQCGNCCRFSSGYVLEQEIKQIANLLNLNEEEFKEKYLEETILFNKPVYRIKTKPSSKPYSECIFLENNLCKIHKAKPLFCKIINCSHAPELLSWYYLNYILDPKDPFALREWRIYLHSGGKAIPGGFLFDFDKKDLKHAFSLSFKEVKTDGKEKNKPKHY